MRWTPEKEEAFQALKVSLCNHCLLTVPMCNDTFEVHTDASGKGVGAVLNVCRQNEELPVAFYSRQLRGAEVRYAATELEALAVVEAVKHFYPFIYGRTIKVITDQQPLTSLMKSRALNRCLQGMALKLMEMDMTIFYRLGKDNGNTDGLNGSRIMSGIGRV